MAATTTGLVTVAEFRRLPEKHGVYQELRNGGVFSVTRPKYKHYKIQRRIRRLLEPLAPSDGLVDTEFSFRALAEHGLRVANVVYLSAAREQSIDPEDNLHGVPDIVIEVLSPLNTAAEIYEKEKLCLENGAKEFWVVDPRLRQVRISTPDARTITWRSGQRIPLALFGPLTPLCKRRLNFWTSSLTRSRKPSRLMRNQQEIVEQPLLKRHYNRSVQEPPLAISGRRFRVPLFRSHQ